MDLFELKNKYSFPQSNPTLKNVYYGHKIKHIDNDIGQDFISDSLGHHVNIVLDLGARLGRTTKFYAEHCLNAHIIAVDYWNEFNTFTSDEIYDFFIGFLYTYRYRISPINAKNDYIKELSGINNQINIIHVGRDFNIDINYLIEIFPNATIFVNNNNNLNHLSNNKYEIIRDAIVSKIRKKPIYHDLMNCEFKNSGITNSRLCFIINCYNESNITVDSCLNNVRKFYPSQTIVLINDGGPNDYSNQAAKYDANYFDGSNIKIHSLSLLWWQRILWLCLEKLNLKCSYFIKMDPDTIILKRMADFPDYDYFGKYNLIRRAGFEYKEMIQGFFKICTKRFMTVLYESNLCCDPKYKMFEFRRELTRQSSEDKILFDICLRMNIKWGKFDNLAISPKYRDENTIAMTGFKEHNPNDGMNRYWNKRKNMQYYKKVTEIINDLKPKSLIDIGNGGCPYISCEHSEDTVTLDIENACKSEKIRSIVVDFMEWEKDKDYELVVCSQVLEHIHDAKSFAEKLFTIGKSVLISVPYKWPSGTELEHIHDPVDEEKIRSWTGRDPDKSWIVTENVRRKNRKDIKRILCLYKAKPAF